MRGDDWTPAVRLDMDEALSGWFMSVLALLLLSLWMTDDIVQVLGQRAQV